MTQQISERSTSFWLKLIAKVFFFTAPLTLIGVLLCCTLIGLPIGLPLIYLACKPILKIASQHAMENYSPVVDVTTVTVIEEEPEWEVPNRADRIKELFNE